MKLNEIADRPGSTKNRKRIGRGIGSGTGKTGGRGGKGQTARTGVRIKGFEGGQMPLHRRLPKRGFNNIFRKEYKTVGLDRIQQAIDAGRLDPKAPVDAAALKAAGVVKNAKDGIRIVANGELTAAVTFEVAGASKSAAEAVAKAGGSLKFLGATEAEPS